MKTNFQFDASYGIKRHYDSNDHARMVGFIARMLPEGQATLVLANGQPGDEVVADVTVCGDYLEIESNLPEWVSVREVYDHLRWTFMPSWEQREWLRKETVMDMFVNATLAGITNRLDRLEQANLQRSCSNEILAEKTQYRFELVGNMWVVQYQDERANLPNAVGFQRIAQLLTSPDRAISSTQLDGLNNAEALAIIASDKNTKPLPKLDGISLKAMLDSHNRLIERCESKRRWGDNESLEQAEEALARFEDEFGNCENDFKRCLKESDYNHNLEHQCHNTVSRSLQRGIISLREHGLQKFAAYLTRFIRPEGTAYAYRPFLPKPDWRL
ncbi:hypothetical protein [Planctomicrobium sp. SH527]|uniref:hypothetical protein n=1 Tax=Planctomicrobium sp. SH527 TaxID=3448123 RepID=UPI003F5B3B2C